MGAQRPGGCADADPEEIAPPARRFRAFERVRSFADDSREADEHAEATIRDREVSLSTSELGRKRWSYPRDERTHSDMAGRDMGNE
jgi:hypothetical protein